MIVERATCSAAAASATVTSRRTSCHQISYFCDVLKKRPSPVVPAARFGRRCLPCPDPPVMVGGPIGCCLINTPISIAKSNANQFHPERRSGCDGGGTGPLAGLVGSFVEEPVIGRPRSRILCGLIAAVTGTLMVPISASASSPGADVRLSNDASPTPG